MPQDYIMDFKEEVRYGLNSYPKLKQLLDAKMKLVQEKNHEPIVHEVPCLKSLDFLQFSDIKFDVMLLKISDWSLDSLQNSLRFDLISDSPSFIVLGCGNSKLTLGRKLLRDWGFRRAEDIVHLQKSKKPFQKSLFKGSKEHWLMGIKGTIRRNLDGHFINSNLDTDVIVTENHQEIPQELFHIMERLCLGRKRMFLTFKDQEMDQQMPGWVHVKETPGSLEKEFDAKSYATKVKDRYIGTNDEIENLRPKSPSNKK